MYDGLTRSLFNKVQVDRMQRHVYTTEHGEADKAGRPGSETAL